MARVKYIISDINGTRYRLLDSATGKIREVDEAFITKYADGIDNVSYANNKVSIAGAKEIKVKDVTTYTGRILEGLNDFDTYCRMNDKFGLLAEYEAGNNIKKPSEISRGSLESVTWVCQKCGHKWQTPIKSRSVSQGVARAVGCPKCMELKGKYYPKRDGENNLANWCKENNRLKLLSEYASDNKIKAGNIPFWSRESMKWQCSKCKKVFHNVVNNRTYGNQGCPHCANNGTSMPELILYLYMSSLFTEVRHRAKILGLEAEVYIGYLNLVIDYRGEYWHSTDDAESRDAYKELALTNARIPFMVIDENQTDNSIQGNKILYARNSLNDILIKLVLTWINSNYNLSYDVDKELLRQVEETAIAMKNNKIAVHSIVETHPEVAARWDHEKNETFKPESVTKGCKYKAWFKCNKCKQSYYSFIRKQTDGQGCPICSGNLVVTGYNDLKTTCPEHIANWNYERNNELGIYPHLVKAGSNKKVYWKCSKCGFETLESIGVKTGYGGEN